MSLYLFFSFDSFGLKEVKVKVRGLISVQSLAKKWLRIKKQKAKKMIWEASKYEIDERAITELTTNRAETGSQDNLPPIWESQPRPGYLVQQHDEVEFYH